MEVSEESKEGAGLEEDQIQLDPSEFLELDIECDNTDANSNHQGQGYHIQVNQLVLRNNDYFCLIVLLQKE